MKDEIEVSDINLRQLPPIKSSRKARSDKIVEAEPIKEVQRDEIMNASNRLRSVIRSKIAGDRKQLSEKAEPKMFQQMVSSFKRRVTHQFECQICMKQCKETPELFIANCQHKLSFCESCMHQYAIYMINQFQEVTCPNTQCDILIDSEGKFFKELPLDVQEKYRKLHTFYNNLNDPSRKMCPRQQCEGVIRKQQEGSDEMVCGTCGNRFCGKCLMKAHRGDCDEFQADVLVKNLEYKKCKRCKMIIQKNQGCNHITCRCGFQFCYVCGADWQPIHYNNHNAAGRPMNPGEEEREAIEPCCGENRPFILDILLMIFLKGPVALLLVMLIVVNSAFWISLALTGFILLGPVGLYCLGIMIASNEAICRCIGDIFQY